MSPAFEYEEVDQLHMIETNLVCVGYKYFHLLPFYFSCAALLIVVVLNCEAVSRLVSRALDFIY